MANKIVIAAGTIDSNLRLAHRRDLGISGLEGLGSRLRSFSPPLFNINIEQARFRDLWVRGSRKEHLRQALNSGLNMVGAGEGSCIFSSVYNFRLTDIRKLMLLASNLSAYCR